MGSRIGSGTRSALLLATLAVVLLPGSVKALDMVVGDITINDLTSFGFTEFTSELTFDGGATDQIYEMFGYLGTATGTVRIDSTNFSEVSPMAQVGNSGRSTLRLEGPAATALGLSAGDILIDYAFTLLDDTSLVDEDSLAWGVTLRNTTASDIAVTLYEYLDLDLGGAADWNDDLATMDTQRVVVTDADDPEALYVWNLAVTGGADHFALGPYPGVRNTLDTMGPAADLSDTVSPFGPADFTAAYQFNHVVPAGGSTMTVSSTNAVPEPDSAVLTAIGLMGLALYGRRR